MGIIGTFIKTIAGVALGTIVSSLIAKYANIGGLTLGSVNIAYSDVVVIALFGIMAFVLRGRMVTIAQVSAIAAGTQMFFLIYKILKQSGVPI